jgi:hypothetical protein
MPSVLQRQTRRIRGLAQIGIRSNTVRIPECDLATR